MTNIIQDTKTALTVATGTTGVGVSSWLDWIPDDIGKLATLVGIALSLVLIYVQLRKGRLERQKLKIELEVLQNADSRPNKCNQGSPSGG